jgi:hypothetical protein
MEQVALLEWFFASNAFPKIARNSSTMFHILTHPACRNFEITVCYGKVHGVAVQTCLKSEQLSCSQIDDTGDLDRAQKGTMRLWDWISLHLYRVMRQRAAKAKVGVRNLGRPWHACTLRSHQMGENARCEWCKKCKKREVLIHAQICTSIKRLVQINSSGRQNAGAEIWCVQATQWNWYPSQNVPKCRLNTDKVYNADEWEAWMRGTVILAGALKNQSKRGELLRSHICSKACLSDLNLIIFLQGDM